MISTSNCSALTLNTAYTRQIKRKSFHTSNEKFGSLTIEPNQLRIPLARARMEMKAISITIMFAIRATDIEAPTANASKAFFSSLVNINAVKI